MSPMVKTPLTMEYALLGFLRDAPMHAYEMHQKLLDAEALGMVWRIKQSQLYALLARLEEVGYLTTVTAPQETRPARKMMYMTEEGRAAFGAWLETPVYWRDHLPAEAAIDGPAIVEQMDTTILIEPGDRATQDQDGNIIISLGAGR